MVCEIYHYLSTKTLSSVRFFDNTELRKLCFPPENWIKMKSIVIMFPLKRSFKSTNLPAPPTHLFLGVAFAIANLLGPK